MTGEHWQAVLLGREQVAVTAPEARGDSLCLSWETRSMGARVGSWPPPKSQHAQEGLRKDCSTLAPACFLSAEWSLTSWRARICLPRGSPERSAGLGSGHPPLFPTQFCPRHLLISPTGGRDVRADLLGGQGDCCIQLIRYWALQMAAFPSQSSADSISLESGFSPSVRPATAAQGLRCTEHPTWPLGSVSSPSTFSITGPSFSTQCSGFSSS